MFTGVIFVCIGNVCRSPVAEGLLRKYSIQYDLGLEISSAGVSALVEEQAQPYSQQVSIENGLDISSHRARQFTRELAYENEIIIPMDQETRNIVIEEYPFTVGKVKPIGVFNGIEIYDPYKQPKKSFVRMYHDIDICLKSWLSKVWDVNLSNNIRV